MATSNNNTGSIEVQSISAEDAIALNVAIAANNDEHEVLLRQAQISDMMAQAEELYPEFKAECVYRTAERALAPRVGNDTDKGVAEFIARAAKASEEKLSESLIPNIMRVDPKVAQGVCRALINTALFIYIPAFNAQATRDEMLAMYRELDDRGLDDAKLVFGQYEGAESSQISLPVLEALVDMLYLELSVAFTDATVPSSRRSTRFGASRGTDKLTYATKKHPITQEWVNFLTLHDAVAGLAKFRDLDKEAATLKQKAARAARGAVDFGEDEVVTADVTEQADDMWAE